MLTCTWILGFSRREKVGIFLSDISGAFDRVFRPFLMTKCRTAGLNEMWCKFLNDYLAPRRAEVIVGGCSSSQYTLSNQVFQGTVLGPPLWNVFFVDVRQAIESNGCSEAKFADDLLAQKHYAAEIENDIVLEDLRICQEAAHSWGERNRVTFDGSKEHFVILHGRNTYGDSFKHLGVRFDTRLLMIEEITRILGRVRPKVKAILRSQRYYGTRDLVNQFKTHALCILEGSTAAVFHAATSHLARLDAIQREFGAKIGLAEEQIFMEYNLAPLKLRRNIAALGFLHRVALGLAHPDIAQLFPFESSSSHRFRTRLSIHRHDKQLMDRCNGSQNDLVHRSFFGMVRIYNLLPQHAINMPTVSCFQKELTKMTRNVCQTSRPWQSLFCSRTSPLMMPWLD